MVMLEAAGIPFTVHEFHHEAGEKNYGLVAAEALGIEPDQVFKTLVSNLTVERGIEQVVGIVPVSGQLSLRGLAAALGAKRAEMCPTDAAERITGRKIPVEVIERCRKRLKQYDEVVKAARRQTGK